MNAAFNSSEADFSGMTENETSSKPYINSVLQKAYVKVDEKGTTAAAATSISFEIGAIAVHYVNFIVDRPFEFVIVDKKTRAILFIGLVKDPRKS